MMSVISTGSRRDVNLALATTVVPSVFTPLVTTLVSFLLNVSIVRSLIFADRASAFVLADRAFAIALAMTSQSRRRVAVVRPVAAVAVIPATVHVVDRVPVVIFAGIRLNPLWRVLHDDDHWRLRGHVTSGNQ
jgi:hypothetical protein